MLKFSQEIKFKIELTNILLAEIQSYTKTKFQII